MKLIYIANIRFPTYKAHGFGIARLCEQFAASGLGVELVVPRRKNEIKDDWKAFYGIKQAFQLTELAVPDVARFGDRLGRVAGFLQKLFFATALLFKRIPKTVVVYTRDLELGYLFALRGYRVVYECHDWFSSRVGMRMRFAKRMMLIVATNPFIAEEFTSRGVDEKRVLVAPNGVDLSFFDLKIEKGTARTELGLADFMNKHLLVYTGSFTTMGAPKGIDEILHVLQRLPDEVCFVAVGGSEEDCSRYHDLAKTLGVDERARFVSRVSQDQLALYQQASDMLMMPFPDIAHYREHMTPIKMFEYMAANRPIIASGLPSIQAVLTEKDCFFVEPGSVESIEATVEKALQNADEADRRARAAYEKVAQFTWESRAEKIVAAIKKFL